MSYSLPSFNLVVNVWHRSLGNFPGVPPDLSPHANLQFAQHSKVDNESMQEASLPYLLLPKLTDVRGYWDGNSSDVVEAPAGSARYYFVNYVDDVGKGFGNEYRIAGLLQATNPSAEFGIPFPIPLP